MIENAIDELLSAIMQENMEYALSLVGHAAYVPPHENESILVQFRNSKMRRMASYPIRRLYLVSIH